MQVILRGCSGLRRCAVLDHSSRGTVFRPVNSIIFKKPHVIQKSGTARDAACCSIGRSTSMLFATAADDTIELELKVEGMMCGGCSSRVEEVLKQLECVTKVSVNHETKLAQIEVKASNQIDAVNMMPSLVQAIKDLGFEAEPHF